jgi:hypothetical protein
MSASSALMLSYVVDTNCYADSSATYHITTNLEKLTTHDKYLGHDQVHIAIGSGMTIDQVGHSTIHTPSRGRALKNILYIPKDSKNLVSVHRFTHDNHVFLELHPCYFLIKYRATKRVLYHDKVEKGLYSL